jgi:hypothetical protein
LGSRRLTQTQVEIFGEKGVFGMENIIIGCFVFAAFFRAAREYGKNAVAWGLIGLVAFFVPYFAFPIFAVMLIASAGLRNATSIGFSVSGLVGFGVALATVIWTYNKLMERAIDAQAALDAQASASQGASESR